MIGIGCFENSSEEDVKKHIIDYYWASEDFINKFEILFAYEDSSGYEEYSFFLLQDKETGKLYENHASHCSCNGFEDQFSPKETTINYLKSEHFSVWCCDKEVKEFVATL